MRISDWSSDVCSSDLVLHTTAADHHHRVLLQVMALAGNVAADLEAVGQAHARHLTKSRVRLLRRRGVDAGADPPLLRAGLQSRHLVAHNLRFARLTDQLVDRWH